jgi:hypothetical protein
VPVELGYARHVHKAQGVTVDTGDLAVSLRTHLNELYVMVSRAREGARIHALTAELKELQADLEEVLAELEAAREAGAEQLELLGLEGRAPQDQVHDHRPAWQRREDAEREDHLLPAERKALEGRRQLAALPAPSADLVQELRDAIARRQAEKELAAIHEIERRAKPSTKEAVGVRPISEAGEARPAWEHGQGCRGERRGRADLHREDRAVGRWRRSPSLDPQAPQQAREAADEAAQGRVAVPPSAAKEPDEFIARIHRRAGISVDAKGVIWTSKPPVEPYRAPERLALPARDAREALARAYMDDPDTARALGYLQLAGRVEYTADPMIRAIERLEADREAFLVVSRVQEQRVRGGAGEAESAGGRRTGARAPGVCGGCLPAAGRTPAAARRGGLPGRGGGARRAGDRGGGGGVGLAGADQGPLGGCGVAAGVAATRPGGSRGGPGVR